MNGTQHIVLRTVTASAGAWLTLALVIQGEILAPTTVTRIMATMAVVLAVMAVASIAVATDPAPAEEISSRAEARRGTAMRARAWAWLVLVTVPLAVVPAVLAESRTAWLVVLVALVPAVVVAGVAVLVARGGGRGEEKPARWPVGLVWTATAVGAWAGLWWGAIVIEHIAQGSPTYIAMGALTYAGIAGVGIVASMAIGIATDRPAGPPTTFAGPQPHALTARLRTARRLDPHTWTALAETQDRPPLALREWRQIDAVDGLDAVEIVLARGDDSPAEPDWKRVESWLGRRIHDTAREGMVHTVTVVDAPPSPARKSDTKSASHRGRRG